MFDIEYIWYSKLSEKEEFKFGILEVSPKVKGFVRGQHRHLKHAKWLSKKAQRKNKFVQENFDYFVVILDSEFYSALVILKKF